MTREADVVHVVDDDQAVRESLTFLLASANLGVRAYPSALALLTRASGLGPGCIVTDIRMPEMNGLELVAKLKELSVAHPIIVLTGHADVALAVEAMKAGVVEFLEKPFDDGLLVRAIRRALEQAPENASDQAARSEAEARLAKLTERERQVFDAVVAGASNKAAARSLGISPRTVEIYRANVMQKMEAGSLSALVRMAMRCGRA